MQQGIPRNFLLHKIERTTFLGNTLSVYILYIEISQIVSTNEASIAILGIYWSIRMYSFAEWAPSPAAPRPSMVGIPRADTSFPSLPPPTN